MRRSTDPDVGDQLVLRDGPDGEPYTVEVTELRGPARIVHVVPADAGDGRFRAGTVAIQPNGSLWWIAPIEELEAWESE